MPTLSDLISVKLKNKILIIFLLLIAIIFMSSCKKEDVDVVSNQYNFSFVQDYSLTKNKTLSYKLDSSDFSDSFATESAFYLSYGVSFDADNVEINQIEISNQLYNWTFKPEKFELNNNFYYGKRSLLIPNKNMISDEYTCKIFLRDGTVLTDSIKKSSTQLLPLTETLSINGNYILLESSENEKNQEQLNDILDSMNDAEEQSNKILNIEDMKDDGEANYDIRLYQDGKVLLDRQLNLDLESNIAMFSSSNVKNCDTILLIRRIDNTTVSYNRYNIVED